MNPTIDPPPAKRSNRRVTLLEPFTEMRTVLLQFSMRKISMQTRGSLLGNLWMLLNPLLLLALFTVVFGVIMGGDFRMRSEAGIFDFPLGIFLGLMIVGLLTDTFQTAPLAILNHPNLVKKVVFPAEVLALSNVAVALYRFLMSLILFLVAVTFVGPPLTLNVLWAPLIFFPVVLMAVGAGYALAALGVFFRDCVHMMTFIGQVLFYSSAVFYSSRRIKEQSELVHNILQINPVLQAIELSRDIFLWEIPVEPWRLVYLWIWGIVIFVGGHYIFQSLKSSLADSI